MTNFNTQVCGAERSYRLQFETDNEEYYRFMEKAARLCVDGKAELVLPLTENLDWQLYTYYRDRVPVAYRYGPAWVAQQLLMEGGYPTPEEAKLAWLREWENHK